MRLTKLYIHNYKSFYDTTIELDKINIVVGENNSGKSNLIDVLEFVDIAMSKDIERAISDKGGYDNLKNYSAVGEEKVIVRATFLVDKDGKDDGYSGALFDGFITLSFSFTEKYFYFTKCVDIPYIKYIHSTKKYFINSNDKIKDRIFLYRISNFINFDKSWIKEIWGDIRLAISFPTYYFNSQSIKDKSNQDSREIRLLKDGSNLGKVLYEIKKEDKNRFEIISNSLISTVNEIDGVEIYKVAGNYIIAFKERGEEPIPIHKVSDGTINFLATITALNQIDNYFPALGNGSLLIFEEPERHLHLNAVNYMLEAFRDSEKQILITTHSTEILKYANLDEIIFIYRDSDGDTQSIRADKIPNLKKKMKELGYERDVTLDELIAEGMIGTFE